MSYVTSNPVKQVREDWASNACKVSFIEKAEETRELKDIEIIKFLTTISPPFLVENVMGVLALYRKKEYYHYRLGKIVTILKSIIIPEQDNVPYSKITVEYFHEEE